MSSGIGQIKETDNVPDPPAARGLSNGDKAPIQISRSLVSSNGIFPSTTCRSCRPPDNLAAPCRLPGTDSSRCPVVAKNGVAS